MKEFNLELAKAGHPVQTRDGRTARIICYDRMTNGEYKLVVLVQNCDIEEAYFYTEFGNINNEEEYHRLNLVMSPTKKEGWVNVYKSFAGTRYCGNIYSSEEEAINHNCEFGDTHLNTIRIQWEE